MSAIKKADILNTRPYLDTMTGEWCVQEQLYPESRGYQVHRFKDVDDALRFMQAAA